jgi:hypothetical protein
MTTRQRLLKFPREERAKAQGLLSFEYAGHVNGFFVKRLTRRYWFVNGSRMKLNQAIEVMGETWK